MKTRVAIYGFGRLGRAIYHIASRRNDLEIVMVVSDESPERIVDTLMNDMIYASLEQQFEAVDGGFHHAERHVHVRPVKTADLWKEHDIDVVIDTLTDDPSPETLRQHQQAGAKQAVFVNHGEKLPLVTLGTNEDALLTVGEGFTTGGASAAAVRPVLGVIGAQHKIERSLTTVIDGLLCCGGCTCAEAEDVGKKDEHLPHPILVASVCEVSLLCSAPTTVKKLNDSIKAAASEPYFQGIIAASETPVEPDTVIGESLSALVDLSRTAVDGKLATIKIWYDREWGYANRIVELTADFGKMKGGKK